MKSTADLRAFAKKGDVKHAVRHWPKPGFEHRKGDTWSFWMEDDPRRADGILPLGKYRCVESGDDNALWERISDG